MTVLPNPVDYIERYPERTIRILGISYQEWQELTAVAKAYAQQQQEKSESSKIRINAKGGGRKPLLTEKEEIGLCLFYLRQMPTFEVNRIHFDISKTEANDTFHKWLPIRARIIASELIRRTKKSATKTADALGIARRNSITSR